MIKRRGIKRVFELGSVNSIIFIVNIIIIILFTDVVAVIVKTAISQKC